MGGSNCGLMRPSPSSTECRSSLRPHRRIFPHHLQSLLIALTTTLLVTLSATPILSATIPAPYLTINNGPTSVPTKIQLNTALFGNPLPSGGLTDNLLIPSGEYGCISTDPLSQNLTASQPRVPIHGHVVFVKNGGGCNFAVKAANMITLGATAVIVYDCPTSEGCSTSRKWPAASDKHPDIPFYIMEYTYGATIRAAIAAGYNISATVPGTGPMDPSDRAALTSLYQALGGFNAATPWSFYNKDHLTDPSIADKSGGLASWEILANSSIDPCQTRLFGVTCVEGRVTQIQCGNCGISGKFPLPTAIGSLPYLTYVNFNLNKLTGPMPCELGQLTRLNIIDLGSNTLTSLSPCLSTGTAGANVTNALPNLQELHFNSNLMTGSIPPEILQISALKVLDLSDNLFTSLSDVSGLTSLTSFLAPRNLLAGEVPTFSGFAALASIDLRNNAFTSVNAGGFALLPKLTSLFLQNNQIYSPMPVLSGLPLLATLDLSNNKFYGVPTLGCSLTDLQALVTLTLKNNSFTSPFTWATCQKLATIDASYNALTSYSTNIAFTAEPQAGKFLGDILPPFSVTVDFSHNQLAGGWVNGLFGRQTFLQTLILNHNNITNIPADLFTGGKYALLQQLDLSYNNLTGEMPGGSPGTPFRIFKLDNNPLLVATATSSSVTTLLPTYFTASTASTAFGSQGEYSCSTLEGPNGLYVSLSPSFYKYHYCSCTLGFFGEAPACVPFPTDVLFNSSSTDSITDGASSGRIRKGLDTYFYLNPKVASVPSTNSNITATRRRLMELDERGNQVSRLESNKAGRQLLTVPVDSGAPSNVVSYKLTFTYFNFSDANRDRLLIYTGLGTSLNPAYTFSQWSPPPAEVQIVASELTIYFTSWSPSGRHFSLDYVALDTYPDGYLPTEYEISAALKTLAIVLIVMTLTALLVLFVFLFYHRSSRLMVASSPLFVYLTVLGAACLNISAIFYIIDPSDSICLARQWLTPISFCVLLTPLFVKTQRLNSIFNMKKLQTKPISNLSLLGSMLLLIAPILLVLVITSSIESTRSEAYNPVVLSLGNYYVPSCDDPTVLMYTSFAYLLGMTLWGTYLSWRVRNLPATFNESASIMNCIVALLLYGVIIFPLQLLIKDQPDATFLLRCIGFVAASWLSTGILFTPKLILLFGSGVASINVPVGGATREKTYQQSGLTDVSPSLKDDSPLPDGTGAGVRSTAGGTVGVTGQQLKSGAFTGSGSDRKPTPQLSEIGQGTSPIMKPKVIVNGFTPTVKFAVGGIPRDANHSSDDDDRLAEAQRNAQINSSMLPSAVRNKISSPKQGGGTVSIPAMLSVPARVTGTGGQRKETHIHSNNSTSHLAMAPTASLTELLTTFFENHPLLLDHAITAMGFPLPTGETPEPTASSSPRGSSHQQYDSQHSLSPARIKLISAIAIKLTGEDPPSPSPISSPRTPKEQDVLLPGQIVSNEGEGQTPEMDSSVQPQLPINDQDQQITLEGNTHHDVTIAPIPPQPISSTSSDSASHLPLIIPGRDSSSSPTLPLVHHASSSDGSTST